MDDRLRAILAEWEKQIEAVAETEEECLRLEASLKPLWSTLFLQAPGKTIAEREAHAYANMDYKAVLIAIADANTRYHRARHQLELRQAEFQASYLSSKREQETIQKYPRVAT